MITKDELARRISKNVGLTKKDTLKILDGLVEEVTNALVEGDSVQLCRFVTFEAVPYNRTFYKVPDRGAVTTKPKIRPKARFSEHFKLVINSGKE